MADIFKINSYIFRKWRNKIYSRKYKKKLFCHSIIIEFPIRANKSPNEKIWMGIAKIKSNLDKALASDGVKRFILANEQLRNPTTGHHQRSYELQFDPGLMQHIVRKGEIVIKHGDSSRNQYNFIFYVNLYLDLKDGERLGFHDQRGKLAIDNLFEKFKHLEWRNF